MRGGESEGATATMILPFCSAARRGRLAPPGGAEQGRDRGLRRDWKSHLPVVDGPDAGEGADNATGTSHPPVVGGPVTGKCPAARLESRTSPADGGLAEG